MSLLHELISFVFPCYCVRCHERLEGGRRFICPTCLDALPRYAGIAGGSDAYHRIAGAISFTEYQSSLIFRHDNAVRPLIHAFKYRGFPELAYQLSLHFAREHLAQGHFADCTAIVPVPLTPERLQKRGYNQSLYIAQGLADVYQIPIREDLLYRHSSRDTQTRRKRDERWQKMAGTFYLREELQREQGGRALSEGGRSLCEELQEERILLVDDLLTTGSTLIHSARPLLEAGIRSLSLYTLALDVLK